MHAVPKSVELPRRYYRPEQRLCPQCGTRLKRQHILWRKSLVFLTGQAYVISWGYRCPNPHCPANEVIYRSAEPATSSVESAERLHLGRRQFAREVVVQVGYWRFWQHATVTEIHERLSTGLHLPVSERQVLHLVGDFLAVRLSAHDEALLRAAQSAKIDAMRPSLAERGGLFVAIDGMQPETGNLCLYVLRDPQQALTLLAESLEDSSASTLERELLAPLKALAQELNLPILGIVSDAQLSIRQAVDAALPGVPHQCCHFHCLRDAGSITFEADRKLKTALKKAIRVPLGRLDAAIRRLSADDPFHPILADYADAIRSTLAEGGIAPFQLGGLRVCDDLAALAASLMRCQEKGDIRSWIACCGSPTSDCLSSNAETSWPISGSGSSIWNTCSTLPSFHHRVWKWLSEWTATWPTWRWLPARPATFVSLRLRRA